MFWTLVYTVLAGTASSAGWRTCPPSTRGDPTTAVPASLILRETGCGELITSKSSIPSLGQVLLVAGGYSASQQRAGRELATTELLLPGRAAWALVGSLPASMHGLRAAAVDNRVFMFGEEAALVINTRLSITIYRGIRASRG